MGYAFESMSPDEILGKPPAAPTSAPAAPPVPASAPKFAFDTMSPDEILGVKRSPEEELAKGAALFEASFGTPTEEAKKKRLSESIHRMTGAYIAPSVMDPKDAERQFRIAEADHASRASPRTSAFLSNAENAKIAMDDAKVLSDIENKVGMVWGPLREGFAEADGQIGLPRAKTLAKSVLAAVGGAMQTTDASAYLFRKLMAPGAASTSEGLAGVLQHMTEPFSGTSESARKLGVINPLRYVSDWAAGAAADADALNKMLLGDQSKTGFWERNALSAAQSVMQSAMSLPAGLAAMPVKAAGAVPLALDAFYSALAFALPGGLVQGGQTYTESRRAGASVFASSARGLSDTATETGFEMIPGSTFLKASKGGTENFAKAFLKAQIPEVMTEIPTTLTQNFTEWAVLGRNKGKTWSDFIDEQPAAVLDTIVTTLMAGGGQVALGAVADASQRKQTQDFGTSLIELAARVAESETRRLHAPTFDAFFQDVTDGATVFIDPDKLTEVLAESKLDLDTVLPTAAAAIANREYVGTGIEIPVSELISGLAGTGFEQAVIEHIRKDPDAMTIAEANKPIDDQMALYQEAVEKALKTGERTAEFNTQIQQIQDDVAYGLDSVGTYTPTANKAQAKAIGAFYAVLADKVGVTPLQLRDGWTDAAGVVHKGIRFRSMAAPMQGFSHGQAMLNVGLDVGATDRTQKIDADFVKAEIEKLGVRVLTGRNVPGKYMLNGKMVDELTYVPRLSRPLTEAEVNQLAVATGQEAIPQYAGGVGNLWGPNAAAWGDFNPEFFKDQMGGTLLGEQAAFDAQQGGLDQKKKADKITEIIAGQLVEQSAPLTAKQWAAVREIAVARLSPEDLATWLAAEQEVLADIEAANRESDVLKETAKEKLDGMPTPRVSTVPLLHGRLKLQVTRTGAFRKDGTRKARVADVARALFVKFRNQKANVETAEGREAMARAMVHEALYSLSNDGHAVGWYDRKVREAIMTFALVHPEVLTSPKHNLAFRLIAAITSNGQAVRDNFILTNDIYKQWKTGGTFPTEFVVNEDTGTVTEEDDEDSAPAEEGFEGGGARKPAMVLAFRKVNTLVEELGWENIQAEMLEMRTVREIEKEFGLDVFGENKDTIVPTAVGLGGPKIGNFFANLSGYFDSPTMDLWFMRTSGRMAGTLLETKPSLLKHLLELRGLLPEKGDFLGYPVETLRKEIEKYGALTPEQRLDAEITIKTLKTVSQYVRARYSKFAQKDPVSGKTYEDKSPENVNSRRLLVTLAAVRGAPSSGAERSDLRAVVTRALELLEKQGISLTAADLQAVLWYHEKNLYSKLGGISAIAKPWDYASAARFSVGRELGLVDVGSRQRAADVRDGQPTSGLAGGLGELQALAQEAQGGALYQQELRRAGAVSGPVVGVHYSQQDRTALSSSAFGQGMKGAERERIAASTDPRLKQRIAFYVNTGAGITPESGVGSHAHVATLTNLYDADADVLKLWRNNRGDLNASESAVLDAGFDGYLKRDGLGAAVLLGPRSQAVEPVAGTDVPVVPSPQIPAAKAAAIALATNTSLINGRQTAAEWKKDLTRLDPDMVAKVEWEKLDQKKLFYRQDLADTLWQGREQWYFSALENALKTAPAKVFGSGKAVAQWLRANAGKMGVKAAEIEATGVTDWLETQDNVTKEQVTAFMAQGGVRLEEVTLGEIDAVTGQDVADGNIPYGYRVSVSSDGIEVKRGIYTLGTFDSYDDAADAISDDTKENTKAKFAERQLPGGENYKEVLITLPEVSPAQRAKGAVAFKSPHYPGTPNILAHVRINVRIDARGKRVLFIEEIQSDWGQEGRKSGFNVPVTAYQVFVDGVAAGAPYESKIDAYDHKTRALKHNAPDKVEIREVQALQNALSADNKGLVPLAPFVTDTKAWTALALKRMIAYAVDNGFDSVAWTTGEQQVERYDLRKVVKYVEARNLGLGKYSVIADTIDGDPLFDSVVTEAELVATIGKELAEKIVAQDLGKYHEYSGLDLKVGGEGMKGYYDGIVPQVANDVLKKIGGGKVGTVDLGAVSEPDLDEENGGAITEFKTDMSAQPGFDITPAMREIVSTKGLPLFAGTPKKGSFSPANMDMRLLADADLSTVLHETSHWFLAAYTQLASEPGAPQALVDEVNTLLRHLFSTVQGGAQAGGDLAQPGSPAFNPVDVLSVAFKRWFGDSKVVDADGKPLRVYHGTGSNISAFRDVIERQGSYFTEDPNFANLFAEGDAPVVYPVFLAIDNPADMRNGISKKLRADLTRVGYPNIAALLRRDPKDYWNLFDGATELRSALEKAGYDGARFPEPDTPVDTWLAFSPTQIKSAVSNTGAFSRKNADILRQDGEVPALTPLPPGATPLEQWNSMSLDQQRPYHEAWAESGEQYFMTGKAPSLALDSVFRTFANWLKRIYGSLKEFVSRNTGGKIHPTTAAFFDRMLATEAEIQQANEARGYVQLFKDAAEAGMTENGWAAYQAMGDAQREDAEAMHRARRLRDMKWLQNARTKIIGAMQKEAEEERKAVREQVATELAATPLRLAVKWLKKGEMTQADGAELKVTEGYKLSKSGVDEIFPEGALTPRPDLSALRGMTAKEGLAPDLVAELANEQMGGNFTSGEDLVRQLLEMKPFKEEVEELTDLRMLQDHSEMIDQAAIERAADEAITNDAYIRMVATELAALANGIGSPAQLTKAAKEYARQLIETKTSKTLKPWSFAAAATRARKAAMTALRKGERDEAQKQSRLDLLNTVATKMSYETEAEVKKIIDRFKKIAGYKDSDSSFKSRDAELVNAVRAILADFGIGTKGKSAREYLAVVQQHNPDLAAVLSDTIDAVTENAKDWRELKISEVRDLAEEIEGLWFLAKRSKQIEIDGKIITLHEAQQAIYDRLDEIGIPDRVPGEGSAVTAAEKRGILFDRFIGALRRVEAWVGAKDGALTGPFRMYMWNPIRDAADAYRADKARYLKAYRDLLAPIAPSLTRRLIDAPEIGYTFGKDEGGMGKLELLHAILHTGNESNKRKLLLGRNWATATENSFDTSKWDAFLQRMHNEGVLTKADYDFAQGVWDLLDSMKPLAQKAHRAVFGKYFAEVTANEFTNQFGTYAGGYVPAMTDPLIVRDQDLNKMREAEEGNMSYAFPTTAKGFTKSRVEYNRPLKLDLRTLSQHIDKVLLFAHMTRPVNDVRRVMSGKSVAQALGRVDPQAYNTLLLPWLNRAAKQVVETQTPGREGLGRFWSVVRARAGMAAMFANVANSVQQITGLSLAAVRVRPGLLMDAMAKFAISPKATAEYVSGKSKFMTTRLENEVSQMSSDINEILLNPSVYESAKEWARKHAYFMQSGVDSVIGPVVWLGGYNQAIEAGLSELDAVRAGDSAVRETQGSQAPEDIAAFETGSAFYRMFTQFAGYFNMNANLLGTEFVKVSRDMGLKKGAGRGLYVLTLGLLVPAIVGELIMQLFKGGPDDDDKDGEYLDDWLASVLGYGLLRYTTAMVPGVGPAINATVNTLNNKPYDDRISTAPAISMIEAAVKAPTDLYKTIVENGKPSKAIKEVATLISMTVGVPASAAAKPVGYLADVATGRVAPTGPVDAVRGTITGTASPASKQ